MLAFNQIFRSGALEALRNGGALVSPEKRYIPSAAVSIFFRDAINRFVQAAKHFGFEGPAVISASLLFVNDYEFALGQNFFSFSRAVADRNHLILPEVWVENIGNVTDIDAIVRPMLDVLWQAFNVERCFAYNEQGVWSPRW